jgi:hypothetical protein
VLKHKICKDVWSRKRQIELGFGAVSEESEVYVSVMGQQMLEGGIIDEITMEHFIFSFLRGVS